MALMTAAPYQAVTFSAFAEDQVEAQATDETPSDADEVDENTVGGSEEDVVHTLDILDIDEDDTPTTGPSKVDADKADSDAESKETDVKLTYEGEDYNITLTGGSKTGLTKDTALDAKEIDNSKDKDSDSEKYEEYMSLCESALDNVDTKQSIKFAKFYDITLNDADGKEMEPSAPVDVEIKFADKLAKELKAEDAAKVRIIHFEKDDKTGKVNAEILGTDDDANNKGVAVIDGESGKTEQLSKSKTGETPVELTITDDQLQGVAFTSDSFSVYGVIYTVDFHYGDGEYDFSIEGESSILLSEVFERLHIDEADFADIESVEFSDPGLIKVEKAADAENDWLLTSLAPFDTEETLTITLNEGSVITINVTDEQQNVNVYFRDEWGNEKLATIASGNISSVVGAMDNGASNKAYFRSYIRPSDDHSATGTRIYWAWNNDGTITYNTRDYNPTPREQYTETKTDDQDIVIVLHNGYSYDSRINGFTKVTTHTVDETLSEEDLDQMFSESFVMDAPIMWPSDEEKAALDAANVQGVNNNDTSKDVMLWKSATYDESSKSLKISLSFFQRQTAPMEFLILMDETGTMSTNLTGPVNEDMTRVQAKQYHWARGAALKATQTILNARELGYNTRVSIYSMSGGTRKIGTFIDFDEALAAVNADTNVGGGTNHREAVQALTAGANAAIDAGYTPFVVYLSDFHSNFDHVTNSELNALNDAAEVYGILMFDTWTADRRERMTRLSRSGHIYKDTTADDPTTLFTPFPDIVDDAIGYVNKNKVIEDELFGPLAGMASDGFTSEDKADTSNEVTLESGSLKWQLANGSSRLRSAKVYTKEITIPLEDSAWGTDVYSGSMPTNGDFTVKDGKNNTINKVSAENSPKLEKDLVMKLGVLSEAGVDLSTPISGVNFTLTDNETGDSWNFTTDSDGNFRIPYSDVKFEVGKTYTLTQDNASTPDTVDIPDECKWTLTVGDDYRIASQKAGADTVMTAYAGMFYIWNYEHVEHTGSLTPIIIQKIWDSGVPSSQRQAISFEVYGVSGTERTKLNAYAEDDRDSDRITELTSADIYTNGNTNLSWARKVYVEQYDSYELSEGDLTVNVGSGDIGIPGEWGDVQYANNDPIPEAGSEQTEGWVDDSANNDMWTIIEFTSNTNINNVNQIDIVFTGSDGNSYKYSIKPTPAISFSRNNRTRIIERGALGADLGASYNNIKVYLNGDDSQDRKSDFSSIEFSLDAIGGFWGWIIGIFTNPNCTAARYKWSTSITPTTIDVPHYTITNAFVPYKKLNISSTWQDDTDDAASTANITKVKYTVTANGREIETPEVNKGDSLSVYIPNNAEYSVKQKYYRVEGVDDPVMADGNSAFSAYTTTASNDSGTFSDETNASFTNVRKNMEVTVQTVWVPDPESDDPVLDVDMNYDISYMTYSGGSSSEFTVSGVNNKDNHWKKTHAGQIPAFSVDGTPTECNITTDDLEETLANYDISMTRDEDNTTHRLTFTITNSLKKGVIEIGKYWRNSSRGEIDPSKPTSINVNVTADGVNETVALDAEHSWNAEVELYVGKTYTITEVVPDQYSVTYERGSGTDHNMVELTEEGGQVRIINEYEPHRLTVSNTVTGEYGDLTKTFKYTLSGMEDGTEVEWIKYEKTSEDGEYSIVGDGSMDSALADENGEVVFYLDHLQKMEFHVPTNRQGLKLTQEEYGGYTTKMNGQVTTSKTIGVMTDNVTVDVVNDFDDGSVVPTGIFSGPGLTLIFTFLMLSAALARLIFVIRRRKAMARG